MVCSFLGLFFWGELREVVGVGVRAVVPLALMESQFGRVYDKVLGLVVPLLRGQGANQGSDNAQYSYECL